LWSLAGFLLVLGPLVFLHELGHYLVGRWCGVKADVFSIGFGRESSAGPTSAARAGRFRRCRWAAMSSSPAT
jgi:membrane-associated protease RseP (regulator of RpoE activity)